MGLENETRSSGIKGQCLSNRSSFPFLLQALSSNCIGMRQSPRVATFMNSEGRFRRLFHVEQRRIPLRYLLSGFRDKFCSRESLTHPLGFYVSPLCLVPSSSASSRSRSTSSLVGRDIHERRTLRCCEQQVSRAPWIVGSHPPFVPQGTSIPSPLRCT